MQFTVAFDTANSPSLGSVSASAQEDVLRSLRSAAAQWAWYLTASDITISVGIQVDASAYDSSVLAQARPGGYYTDGRTDGPATVFQGVAGLKLALNSDLNGSDYDIIVQLTPNAINNDFYYNPNILSDYYYEQPPHTVPAGKFDAVTVFQHELGHGLGIAGLNSSTTAPGFNTSRSYYETFVESDGSGNIIFTGSNALAARTNTSQALILETNSHSHLKETGFYGGDLMSAGGALQEIQDISAINLGVLQDIEVPIRLPTSGNDVIHAAIANPALFLGDGDDYGYAARDGSVIHGGNGGDRLFGWWGQDILYGEAGDDLIYGWQGDDGLSGGDGADWLSGGDGNDILSGGAGNDNLHSGNGNDTLIGGLGNDSYYLENTGTITVFENPDEGTDAILISAQINNFVLPVNFENLQFGVGGVLSGSGNDANNGLYGNEENNTLDARGGDDSLHGWGGDDTLIGGVGNDQMLGGEGADTLNGGEGFDALYGEAGNDVLNGGEGDTTDILDGGAGADTMSGGKGNDNYTVNDAGDVIIELSNEGIDLVNASVDFTLGSTLEQLILRGSNPLVGTGNALDNALTGNLAGSTLRGGLGNDTYVFDPLLGSGGTDTIVENPGEGTDEVSSYISFVLPENVENLQLFGAGNLNGTGSSGDNKIVGNIGDNRLEGGAGDDNLRGDAGSDRLFGGIGNDALDGGLDADRLHGGTGNDTYYVDTQSDLVFENVGEGEIDKVFTSVSFYMYDNIEILALAAGAGDIFGSGNVSDNIMTGNEGGNLILGWDGNDTLLGEGGNDVLYGVNGNDMLTGGVGTDYLIAGEGADLLDGGDGADALYGEAGDDTMYGGTGFFTDILVGGDNNDILDGSANPTSGQARNAGDYDLLYGGTGDDTYYVDTPADLTFEFNGTGEGIDTVFADIVGGGYYLYDSTENLTLLGVTPFGVGNGLDNVLTGSAAANWLLGGASNDTLNGKAGNDVLFGETGADTFVFELGTGGDVIGDFNVAEDKIRLLNTGFSAFDQLTAANALFENGGSSVLNLAAGDFVVINGATGLTNQNFLFA